MSTSPFTSSPSSFFAIPQPTATVPLHPLVRAVLSWCQLHHLPYLCSSFARSTAADLYALTKMDCIAFANGDVIKGTFLYNLIQGFKAGVYSLPIQVTNPNAVIPSTSPTPYSPTQDDTASLSSNSSDPRIPSLHEHHATLPPLINMSIPATYHQDYYLHPPMHTTPNNTSPQLSSFTPFMASNFTATTLHKSPSGLSLYDQSPNQKRKYSISSHEDSVDKQTRAILALQGIAEHTWSESDDNNTPIASPQVSSTSSSPRGRKRTKIEEEDTDDSSEDIHQKRDKPYKCDKCGRGFTVVYSLEAHYRIHTGEKPYKCQFCSRAFTQSGHLTVHERTHTGERPFKCSYCEKTFARPDLARRHERVHTGERPFKCSHCDKAFTTSGNRKVHERRIHAGDDDKE